MSASVGCNQYKKSKAFKRVAMARFGIPVEEQQYWVCVRWVICRDRDKGSGRMLTTSHRRHNRTLRPDRFMLPELEQWGSYLYTSPQIDLTTLINSLKTHPPTRILGVSESLSKIYKSGRYFLFIRRVPAELRNVAPKPEDFIVFFKYFDYEKQTLS